MIIGRQLIEEYEKMYSENDYYEDEKLYSTGDNELDDLLERAFCEGYEYAQKEFAAYKPPFSQEQVRKAVKSVNENGIKGRSVAQVGKNALKQALKGQDKNELRQSVEAAKAIKMKNPTGGHPRMAQRVNKATFYAMKKGIL